METGDGEPSTQLEFAAMKAFMNPNVNSVES